MPAFTPVSRPETTFGLAATDRVALPSRPQGASGTLSGRHWPGRGTAASPTSRCSTARWYCVAAAVLFTSVQALGQPITVVGWNVESGADPRVVDNLIARLEGVDLWGISKVKNYSEDWMSLDSMLRDRLDRAAPRSAEGKYGNNGRRASPWLSSFARPSSVKARCSSRYITPKLSTLRCVIRHHLTRAQTLTIRKPRAIAFAN